MRIITGKWKGRSITTVPDLSVRPATDRVRQALFNMLEHRMVLEGIRVLDLFAGSGSLGFEALSRGAASVTFVESGRQALRHLASNARTLDCEASTEILGMDAMKFLQGKDDPYNLVFADPPYAFEETGDLPAHIIQAGLLSPEGYLLIEHDTGLHFTDTALYHAGPEKKFGRTLVTFFRHPEAA